MERFRFGEVTFDPETRELIGQERNELTPKNAEVLHYLLQHRDRVISRDELFEQLWGGLAVTDHSLTKVITELRGTLGDSARNSTYIRTLHKKGYKWVFEPTTVLDKPPATAETPATTDDEAPIQAAPTETPQEIEADSAPAATAPVHPEPGPAVTRKSRLPSTKLILVAVLIGALLMSFVFRKKDQPIKVVSPESISAPIAMLPFINHTGDPERQWVETGLRDMVARVLSDIPSADLAPMSDLKKATGDWHGFTDGLPTLEDLDKLRLMIDYSWLVRTEVFFEQDAYQLTFQMLSPDGAELSHTVSGPTLTGVTEQMAYAVAAKAGLKPGNPGPGLLDDNFIGETYAKGTSFFEEDDIQKAINHFQVCLDNDPDQIWAKFQMGRCKRFLGEWEESRLLLTQVVEQARLSRNPRMEADALRYLGLLASDQGAWDQAINWTNTAMTLYRNLDHLHGLIVIRNQAATTYARKGEPEKAVDLLNESLTQLPRLGNRFVEAQTLIKLGTVRSMQGRMKDAEEEFHRALAIVKSLGDTANEAALLNNLGNIANLKKDYETAEPYYQAALIIWKQLGNPNSEASTLLNLGLIAGARKDHETAETYLQDALGISRDLGNFYLENLCINQLGVNALISGDLKKAARLLQNGADLARERKNSALECDAICYHALLALRSGDMKKAQALMSQVTELGKSEPLYHTTASLIAYEEGHWQQAYDLQLKARILSNERWSDTDEKVLLTYLKALEQGARQPLPDPQYLPMY